MPPPLECGAGRETEGWADSGGPPPTAFRAMGPARRRLGGAGAPRPPARVGPDHAPQPPASVGHAPPAKFVFREPRLGGAGSTGPSRCLPLGASLPLRTDAGLRSLALPALENPGSGKDERACLVHLPLEAWSFRRPPQTVEKGWYTPPKYWSLTQPS